MCLVGVSRSESRLRNRGDPGNNYEIWNAYNVEAWPTIFLLDKRGRIRWMHVGEGDYDKAEQLIQKLLDER